MRIINLIENTASDNSFYSEHGLSVYIEFNGHHIIFDAGKSDLFIKNADKLGVDLRLVEYLVISHGHYDHTGGIAEFLKLNSHAKVIIKKEAFYDKFKNDNGKMKYIGMPDKDVIQKYGERILSIGGKEEIFKDFFILSDFPDQGTVTQGFFVRENGDYITDKFSDELTAVFKTRTGYCILTGCSHNGIMNILNVFIDNFGTDTIYCLVGGLHLKDKKAEDLAYISQELRNKYKINSIYACHCTGIEAVNELKKLNKTEYFHTGMEILI